VRLSARRGRRLKGLAAARSSPPWPLGCPPRPWYLEWSLALGCAYATVRDSRFCAVLSGRAPHAARCCCSGGLGVAGVQALLGTIATAMRAEHSQALIKAIVTAMRAERDRFARAEPASRGRAKPSIRCGAVGAAVVAALPTCGVEVAQWPVAPDRAVAVVQPCKAWRAYVRTYVRTMDFMSRAAQPLCPARSAASEATGTGAIL